MAGPIQNMAALYKKKSYISPKSPAQLMESTNFTINFKSRKFVHVGIDPTDKFNVTIQILTSSRHVNITKFILKQIFLHMEDILQFVLDKPQKRKRQTFLNNETYKLSSMMNKSESVLEIESKFHIGCRAVLLNRADLMQLKNLECAIRETIERKGVTRAFILRQVDEFGVYLDEKLTQVDSPPKNVDEMKMFIKNVKFDKVITSGPNLASQLKIYAATQLAELWEKRRNKQNSQKVVDGNLTITSSKVLNNTPAPEMVSPTFDKNNHALDIFPNNKNLYDWNDGPQPLDQNSDPRPMEENVGQLIDELINNNLTPRAFDTNYHLDFDTLLGIITNECAPYTSIASEHSIF